MLTKDFTSNHSERVWGGVFFLAFLIFKLEKEKRKIQKNRDYVEGEIQEIKRDIKKEESPACMAID